LNHKLISLTTTKFFYKQFNIATKSSKRDKNVYREVFGV